MDNDSVHRKRPRTEMSPSQGKIEALILENFKSYEGVCKIGPFGGFTCIVGPNGAGKSNVMDAVSFCLGIKAKHLRGDRIRDLVYRKESETAESNKRKASVIVIFRSAAGDLLHLCRTIDARASSTYKYGPPGALRQLPFDEYLRELAKHNIFVKARNFLVFQGDVMDLARRQGTELTGVMETISGSEQYKDTYVRVQKDLNIAREKVRMHVQHIRETENALAQLEKQKADVERYQNLRAKRAQLSTENVLFQMYTVVQEEDSLRAVLQSAQAGLAKTLEEYKNCRVELDKMEAQKRALEVDQEKILKICNSHRSAVEGWRPHITSCEKRVEHVGARMISIRAQIEAEKEHCRELESAIDIARQERTQAEVVLAKLKADKVDPLVRLNTAQRNEYEKAMEANAAQNSKIRDRMDAEEYSSKRIARALAADRMDLQELLEKASRATKRFDGAVTEVAELKRTQEKETQELRVQHQRLNVANEELVKHGEFMQSLLEEQSDVAFKLDAAASRKEKLDQVETQVKIADELRDAFPEGVIGRIVEVARPSQRRFDTAVQMSVRHCARHILVTTTAIGLQCIEYLKKKKIACETFIALDRIASPNWGDMKNIVKGHEVRRLLTSCMEVNAQFFEKHPRWQATGPGHVEKVLTTLFAGTIVTDCIEEAKIVAYGDARTAGLAPSVVTLLGEVISPTGDMSVETLGTSRVDFGDESLVRERAKMNGIRQDIAELSGQINERESTVTELTRNMKEIGERLASVDRSVARLEQEREAEKRQIAEFKVREEELRRNIDKHATGAVAAEQAKAALERDLLNAGKQRFVQLSRAFGVQDIREVLRQEEKLWEEHRKERSEAEEKLRRCVFAETDRMQKKQLVSSHLDDQRREFEGYQQDLVATRERYVDLQSKETSGREQVLAAEARMADIEEIRRKIEDEAKNAKIHQQERKVQTDALRKNMKNQSESLARLLAIRCNIFRDALLRQVEVPLTSERADLENMLLQERDLENAQLAVLEALCALMKVDFRLLPEEKTELAQQTRSRDRSLLDAEYERKIAEVERELQGINPNMRAAEQFAGEESRLQDIRRESDQASADASHLASKFEAVKRKRADLFTKCYKHVEMQVQPFYRELTSYDGCDGGSAYLDVDDSEEPYNGGVTFTACPPGKRFFPMELLSGGEKSMASLALLLAMHSFMPPPFMILDEIDAPFDQKNTGSLVRCIQQLKFQCVVISLKDRFFSNAETLVGIYKDRQTQSSASVVCLLGRICGQGNDQST